MHCHCVVVGGCGALGRGVGVPPRCTLSERNSIFDGYVGIIFSYGPRPAELRRQRRSGRRLQSPPATERGLGLRAAAGERTLGATSVVARWVQLFPPAHGRQRTAGAEHGRDMCSPQREKNRLRRGAGTGAHRPRSARGWARLAHDSRRPRACACREGVLWEANGHRPQAFFCGLLGMSAWGARREGALSLHTAAGVMLHAT